MAGFPFSDVYALFHPDRLHVNDVGITVHLLDVLAQMLSAEEIAQLSDDLQSTPRFHGLRVPSCGFDIHARSTKVHSEPLDTWPTLSTAAFVLGSRGSAL